MKEKLQVVRNMGLPWTMFRVKYEIEKKLGILKNQYPTFSYKTMDLYSKIDREELSIKSLVSESLMKNFFQLDYKKLLELEHDLKLSKAIKVADDILSNKFYYYSKIPVQFEQFDWHYSPHTKTSSPKTKHWTEISDLTSEFGDIKWIWELSRFTFSYHLGRAYVITGDEKYSKCFWSIFDHFIENNPPELGANYKCGQEMSLRVMAWIFALNVFINSHETTEARLETILKAIYHHADHIEKHFDFALKSVKNNHSLSEAVGMYTVGTVFDFFNLSKKWKDKGLKYLQSEVLWQVYDDGSYIQHSFNYQRLAIQDITWFLRLAEINNDSLNNTFVKKFKKTVEFLYQMQNDNGMVPNYGMNDGAYIHPLTSNEYLDYRPSLQSAWLVLTGNRLYEENEVDEISLWLGLDVRKKYAPPIKESKLFQQGGYATIRNNEQFTMIRCATYKHRPVQADMLHIDFWDNEFNILADAGTFSYNTSQEDLLYFNGTSSHNTIKLNNQDQMKKASRFIWLNWTKSKIVNFKRKEKETFFEGEHYGYSPIVHRRGIYQSEDILVVVDDLSGQIKNECVSLSWLFGVKGVRKISETEIKIELPNNKIWTLEIFSSNKLNSNLLLGSLSPVAGWRSLFYGYKEAFPQLVVNSEISNASRFITILRKDNRGKIEIMDDQILIGTKLLKLLPIQSKTIFDYMEL